MLLKSRDKRRGRKVLRRSCRVDQRQANRETAAMTQLAIDDDFTTHQLAELLAQREAKARAAIFTCA